MRSAVIIAVAVGITSAGMVGSSSASPESTEPAPADTAAAAPASGASIDAAVAADASAPMDPNMPMAPAAVSANTTSDILVVSKVAPGDISKVGGSSSAGWEVSCPFSHALKDDPIVFFGKPGASHQHDFMGAKTTNASSTTATMQAASAGTTCAAKDDTSAYWVPTLFSNGTEVHPVVGVNGPTGVKSRQTMYYRNPTGRKLHPFPAGLRILAGNPMAKSAKENPQLGHNIWWGCSDNSISAKLVAPPSSCPRGMITIHINFPNCWDGVNLDSPNHQSHVAYSSGGNCPSSHPVIIPRLTIRNEYIVGKSTGKITLATGDPFTMHGDFWNQWKQPALEKLVASCFNAGKNCGKLSG